MELTFRTKIQQQIQAVEYWNDQITEELLYGGAKGGGKSYLGAFLIFNNALIYPETHYFIARLQMIDIKKYTVPVIYELFKNLGLKWEDYMRFDSQLSCYVLYNGSRVFLLECKETPSDPMFERFGSMPMTQGWIEEGGEVAEAAKANLMLSIGRWKNQEYKIKKKLLITANPKKGWMKRQFIDVVLPPERKFIQSFVTDNLYMSPDYIATLRNEKDVVRRQRLYEGKWDYDEDQDSLVGYNQLTDLFSNTIIKDNQKYLTVDVARFGKDTTTFLFWDGLEIYKIEQRAKQDVLNTIQTAKDFAAIERIPWSNIMIDEDGVGGGVVDGMPGARGFVANSTPLPTRSAVTTKIKYANNFIPKTNFVNLKSQCGFKLATLIEEHKIAIKVIGYRETLLEELSAVLRHKNADSDGKLQLKPKDEVKETLGRSPDLADAMIFRMWFELKRDAVEDTDPNRPDIKEQVNRFNQRRQQIANSSSR